VIKWAGQLKFGNDRTMTFVDKNLLNCSSSPLYVSLSRNTGRALHAFEYEMNLTIINPTKVNQSRYGPGVTQSVPGS
jgi:hypothetical protein